MARITVIGEALVDLFALPGESLATTASFTPRFGGAPANLAASAAKLGGEVEFIGRVGEDGFGDGVKTALKRWGVDVRHVIQDPERATMLACVALPTPDNPEFLLLPGANTALLPADIPDSSFLDSALLAYGSVTLAYDSKPAVRHAAHRARGIGLEVLFDVNFRPNVWKSLKEARQVILDAMADVSVVKLNLDECEFLLQTRDTNSAAERLMDLGPELVAISKGAAGSEFITAAVSASHKGFAVDVVDATGAGDAFLAGVAVKLAEFGLPIVRLSAADLREIAEFSNAAGALAATKLGAMDVKFTRSDVAALVKGMR